MYGGIMKKVFDILIIAVFLIVSIYFFNICRNNIDIKSSDSRITNNILYKGLEGSTDFTVDDKGNYYISFKNEIQFINSSGKSFVILKDNNLNIYSLEYFNKKLYFSSDRNIYCYDIEGKKNRVIINDLPNYGDYKNSLIKINDNKLYVTIGAATNSGVVGKDNLWEQVNSIACDLSPFKLIMNGEGFGTNKTGAFVPYNTKNVKGQVISGHYPGNSSIIEYNISSGKNITFAWGIRNVTGLDFDSNNRLYSIVGGMEPRGLRSVNGDTDYIYEIEKDKWYGWPDYSGGDPIISPRFKDNSNKKIEFIIKEHPSVSPPAPFFQYNSLGVLKTLAIDKVGIFGEKDSIYFCNIKDNILYKLNKFGNVNMLVSLGRDKYIENIKFIKDQLIILDSKNGFLYKLQYNKK
jgi:hypothetical protein